MTNTSISMNLAERIRHARVSVGGAAIALGGQLPSRGAVREWLPVPAPSQPKIRTAPRKAASATRPIWLGAGHESKAEKVLLGLLATAAVIGIAYGFSCMLDLVQGWAGFNAGIAQLVH